MTLERSPLSLTLQHRSSSGQTQALPSQLYTSSGTEMETREGQGEKPQTLEYLGLRCSSTPTVETGLCSKLL